MSIENNNLISVIIPIYNAEKYLRECINSVLNQTYKNFELLLIDDGSTDGSGTICNEYANNDSRVKVVHKQNGGVSAARNSGLELAKGEYVAFVDSDDFVNENYLLSLYKKAIETNADLVFCKFARYINGQVLNVNEDLPENLLADINDDKFADFVLNFFHSKNYIFGSACRILYKKSALNSVRFNNDVKICEDLVFVLQVALNAKKITSINEFLYFYRLSGDSVTRKYIKNLLPSHLNLNDELKNIFDSLKAERCKKIFNINACSLCYVVFVNELKFRVDGWRKNIKEARKSELYKYFKLKNGLKFYGLKRKIKFLIVWFLVKTRLV